MDRKTWKSNNEREINWYWNGQNISEEKVNRRDENTDSKRILWRNYKTGRWNQEGLIVSNRETADEWIRNRTKNENMNNWLEMIRCNHQTRLIEKHETNDQLRRRDSGTEKYWSWKTPGMITESQKNIQQFPRENTIIRKSRSWSCYQINPGSNPIVIPDIRKNPRPSDH